MLPQCLPSLLSPFLEAADFWYSIRLEEESAEESPRGNSGKSGWNKYSVNGSNPKSNDTDVQGSIPKIPEERSDSGKHCNKRKKKGGAISRSRGVVSVRDTKLF